jgi:predicted nucleic acid-binding protein
VYLVDTNVTSEARKGSKANPDIREFWHRVDPDTIYLPVQTIGEIRRKVWGKLMSPHNQHPIDKQIAAIGLIHGLTVVTRNTVDFADTGVPLLNPFQ